MKYIQTVIFFLFVSSTSQATNYYINAKLGNDKNNGKSHQTPWKTLTKVSSFNFKPGDVILLAKGQEFFGSIQLINRSGTKAKPIIISNYNAFSGDKNPTINAKGFLNGILLINCSYINVEGLTIMANGGVKPKSKKKGMRCGVLVTTSKVGVFKNITVNNLVIKDVFYERPNFQRGVAEVKTANGLQSYGWGIRFINNNKGSLLKNITVQSCKISNIGHTGIKITGSVQNLKLVNNTVFKTGGPGMQMSGVKNAHVKGNNINYSGTKDDSRKWGRGSGLWTWGCDSVIIEHNSFRNANGPADSAGCHIDFNCKNIIVQYNLSENNAGGFCEILGNNWNCAYRYNVSINDGHRIKKKGIAFQEGKIYWLSGFVGKNKKRHGPYNSYFYNNTIYVKSDIVAKMAVAKVTSGALLANNIFYIEGESKAVLGDQYQPQKDDASDLKNIVFKNNLFLKAENWPKKVAIQDEEPVYGNPHFVNAGGKKITDYIPTNTDIIKDKGIEIPHIPKDKKGLMIGLKVEKDILGNTIKGLPDMGAIELN